MLNPGVELPERHYDPSFVLWDEHEGEDSDDEELSDEMDRRRGSGSAGIRGGVRVSQVS